MIFPVYWLKIGSECVSPQNNAQLSSPVFCFRFPCLCIQKSPKTIPQITEYCEMARSRMNRYSDEPVEVTDLIGSQLAPLSDGDSDETGTKLVFLTDCLL